MSKGCFFFFAESSRCGASSRLLNLVCRTRVWNMGRKTKEWVKLPLRPAGHIIEGFTGTAWQRRGERFNLKLSFHSSQMSLCKNMKSPSAFFNLRPAALWPLHVTRSVGKVALQFHIEQGKFPGRWRWKSLKDLCSEMTPADAKSQSRTRTGLDLDLDLGAAPWSFWWGSLEDGWWKTCPGEADHQPRCKGWWESRERSSLGINTWVLGTASLNEQTTRRRKTKEREDLDSLLEVVVVFNAWLARASNA